MCKEDLRMARDTPTQVVKVPCPAGTATPIAPASALRTKLVLSGDGITVARVSSRATPPTATFGFVLTAADPVLKLDIEDIGTVIQSEWLAFPVGATVEVAVIDGIHPKV